MKEFNPKKKQIQKQNKFQMKMLYKKHADHRYM